MSRADLGIALGADHLVAVDLHDGRASRRQLHPINGEPGWPSLAAVLGEIAAGRRVAIALLSPLAEVRQLSLPPLGDVELVQLLQRNAASYFSTQRGAQSAAVTSRRSGRGLPATVIAMAAPSALIAAIHDAARQADATITAIGPAESAWVAGAIAASPSLRRGVAYLVVSEESRISLLGLDRGKWRQLRRFRAGVAERDLLADATSATPIAVAGDGQSALAGALARPGAPTAIVADATDAELFAARFAASAAGPLLRTDADIAGEQRTLRRATFVATVAAILLVIAAAGLQLWSVHRALRIVEAERAAIRSQVAATLVGRSSIDDAYRRSAAIIAAERAAPRWSAVLADLTVRVPDNAWLTTLRARGDSVLLDGIATSTSQVFNAVAASPLLRGVRAPAPVRRLSPEGADPTERFTLAGELSDSGHAAPRAGAMKK